jgi:hypothetical protein
MCGGCRPKVACSRSESNPKRLSFASPDSRYHPRRGESVAGLRVPSSYQRRPREGERTVEQRDAADEGRLDACGSSIFGNEVIVSGARSVRPSQLIASVGPTSRSHGARVL